MHRKKFKSVRCVCVWLNKQPNSRIVIYLIAEQNMPQVTLLLYFIKRLRSKYANSCVSSSVVVPYRSPPFMGNNNQTEFWWAKILVDLMDDADLMRSVLSGVFRGLKMTMWHASEWKMSGRCVRASTQRKTHQNLNNSICHPSIVGAGGTAVRFNTHRKCHVINDGHYSHSQSYAQTRNSHISVMHAVRPADVSTHRNHKRLQSLNDSAHTPPEPGRVKWGSKSKNA